MPTQLEQYLEEVSRPLPLSEREEWRTEAEQHLIALIDAYEELGHSREQSTELALARSGVPLKLGQRMETEFQCDRAAKRDLFSRIAEVIYLGSWWMVVWGLIAQALVSLILFVDPSSIGPGESPAVMGWIVGKSGFASGILFGLLLFVREPKKRTGDVGWVRAAIWGALAGGLTSVIGFNEAHLSNTCVLGVVAAFASVGFERLIRWPKTWMEGRSLNAKPA